MQRHTSRSFHPLAGACGVLCAVLLFFPRGAAAQEYYGVPIEEGGVAFLLDVSGSMDNRGERIVAAVESAVRDIAEAWRQGTGRPGTGQSRGRTTVPASKMRAARGELLNALNSLGDGTNFTIITFGAQAAEWPGGVRPADPRSRALAREYVTTLSAAGGTPMAEAIQLGFEPSDVRTLFVVSDGRPTTAPVLDIVKRLQASREGRRMVINTVGIGSDQDGGLLCQLALDNEGIYVRDGTVACTFSPCPASDGVVTFYPPTSHRKRPTTARVCSSAEHRDCTPEQIYGTMLSEARFQTPRGNRTEVTNCLEVDRPDPVTIVLNPEGLEATTYTRPGHPYHPSKVTRIVKQQGDDVVVETTGIGKGGWDAFKAVDKALTDAVESGFDLEARKPPVVPEEPAAPLEAEEPEETAPQEPEVTQDPDAPFLLPTAQRPPPPPPKPPN